MIYLNGNELDNLHAEDKEIQRVLLGDKLIWENNKILRLGTGTSINIQSLYSKYSQLSASNFFILSTNTITGNSVIKNSTGYLTIRVGFTKGYSNGTITQYVWCNSNTASTTMVLVTKPSKLTYLGVGTSFNVKSKFPNDYQNMTVNNFLISGVNQYNGGLICNNYRGVQGDWSADNTHQFVKSYNASTGVLTCYFRDYGDADGIDTWDVTSPVYVYASKKAV